MDKFDKTYEEIGDMLREGKFKSIAAGALMGVGALTGGVEAASSGTPSHNITVNDTRGARNNNPGNIEATGKWQEWEGAVGTDGRFIIFDSTDWGVRAIARILQTYKSRYGVDTMRGVIEKWAPPKENDTEAYIRNVEQWSKVKAEDKIDLSDHDTLRRLISAIIRMETSAQVTYGEVQKGLNLMNKNFDGTSQ